MQNIDLWGAQYSDVPSVLLPKHGGGTAQFDDTTIASDAATAGDIASGKKAYVNGSLITGTGSGGGGIVISDTTDVHGGTIREITAVTIAGTKSITSNGTGIDVTSYAAVDVAVPAPTPSLQTVTKSYTPTETAQTETITPGTGYDGIGEVDVTVGAISSSYVGSGVTRRDSTDLSASGATVSVPSGYYASNASKAVSSGSATTPATSITANPSISVSSGGLITATASTSQSVTPTVSAGYVSSGTAGTVSVSGSNTSQLTTQAAQTIYPSTSDQTISSGRYLTGTQTIKGVAVSNTLTAENVKSGVVVTIGDSSDADRIMSVTGTYSGGGTSKNVQVAQSTTRSTSTTYTKVISLTCTKSGTYDVYWSTFRTSTSSTWGSQLYLDDTAYGSAQTGSWSNHIQNIHLTNVQIDANEEVSVRVRSRGSNYYGYVGTLTIIEV